VSLIAVVQRALLVPTPTGGSPIVWERAMEHVLEKASRRGILDDPMEGAVASEWENFSDA
jgi:hypothetical protein